MGLGRCADGAFFATCRGRVTGSFAGISAVKPLAIACIAAIGIGQTPAFAQQDGVAANRGQAPQLMSGGRPVDWIFIDDAAEGLIRMAHAGPVDGSYVDLGSGQLVTTGDVAERICSIAESGVTPDFGAVPDRAMEQVRVADTEATEVELGWTPATGLDKGLEITYRWYQDHPSGDA